MNAAGAPAAKWSGTFLRAIVASPRNLRSKQGIVPTLIAFLPFVAWEGFSLLYYGVPFPNTAYAKLNTGTPTAERLAVNR